MTSLNSRSNGLDTEVLHKLSSYLEEHRQQILQDLLRFIEHESPTNRKDLVDRCGSFIRDLIKSRLQHVEAKVVQQSDVGDFHQFTIGAGEGKPLLIVGHIDTVWDEGQLPIRLDGPQAFGPGIYDMKGGIIQTIWALRALQQLKLPLNRPVILLLNTDEETGSVASRSLIESLAKDSEAVFIPEPPEAKTGALKTARKGWGKYTVKCFGRSAHAGNEHEAGRNAIDELARQILFLHSQTDYALGTTVNVGVIKGGTRFNVVPDEAEMEIDLRVATREEEYRLDALIQELQPTQPDVRLEVIGGIGRPAMVRSTETGKLAEKAKEIADHLGFSLGEASVGGTSDGNFTAALGIPTLDGLGAEGEGAHAKHEHVLIDSLPRRAALIAALSLSI